MAIFGIGAYYDGTTDVTGTFIQAGRACVGWDQASAPTLHQIMRQLRVGDVLYIKSFNPNVGLTIKAVGFVRTTQAQPVLGPGESCVAVDWVWRGSHVVGHIDDKYNVRSITLYEEFNPDIQGLVLDGLRGRGPLGAVGRLLP